MKKLILFFLISGLIVFLGACNTSVEGPPGDEDPIDITDGGLYVLTSSATYPGAEIDLSEKLDGQSFLDISNYASVTVDAVLYSDEAGETLAVKTNEGDNLAQFKLLKATGNWDDDDNICGPTKYNMAVEGPTTWTVPGSASGVPAILLLQANWAEFPEAVKSIKVNSITFTPKTSDVVLDVVYGESFVSVNGNKITFMNAEYKDGAAQYAFPDSFPASLAGKQLVVNYTIDEHTCVPSGSGTAGIEHQIHVQAANSDKYGFNGRNETPGQKYITLDDAATTGWDGTGGSFKVSLNDLLAAAGVADDANDCKGPFELDAIRIVNNGTTWTEGSVTHIRCKSYTLVIDSVQTE
jgi:hypothetical protein